MRWRTRFGAVALVLWAGGCEFILGVEEGKLRTYCAGKLEGTPLLEQTLGDCLEWVCDGNGVAKLVKSPSDVEDGNPCTNITCSSTCAKELVLSLAAGSDHTCALLWGGAVKCWGRNNYGQLGLGDKENRGDGPDEMGNALQAVSLGNDKYAIALAAGAFHTCALLSDGTVKCWGLNGIGQLGLGDTKTRGDGPDEMGDQLPTLGLGNGKAVKSIVAGAYHTCALLNDDSIKCWGANASGQLGLGDSKARGNLANHMGNDLPAVNVGNESAARTLSAGGYFTCVLFLDGSMKCWGHNGAGQLGLGDTEHRGDDANEMGNSLPAINYNTGEAAGAISTGSSHTCVWLEDERIKCWGSSESGQLGLGSKSNRGGGPGEMGNDLPLIELGINKAATRINLGAQHSCGMLSGGKLKCWGWNEFGQLGLGDTNNRGDQPGEMGEALPLVELAQGATMIAAGYAHTCALLDDGSVKCWGANTHGQLGLGDVNDRGDEPGEMGEMLPRVKLFSGEW